MTEATTTLTRAEGYLVYAEFAADFQGRDISTLDAHSSRLTQSRYFLRDGKVKTINLHSHRPGRPEAFCIYDKKQADWEQHRHLRRGPLVRIEAKRRFNRTPTHREIQLADVLNIRNPFASLQIYERGRIEQVFTASRHRNFLAHVQREGVHAAIAGTRGADRSRRERMLEDCRAEWWNPEDAWEGTHNAVDTALML